VEALVFRATPDAAELIIAAVQCAMGPTGVRGRKVACSRTNHWTRYLLQELNDCTDRASLRTTLRTVNERGKLTLL